MLITKLCYYLTTFREQCAHFGLVKPEHLIFFQLILCLVLIEVTYKILIIIINTKKYHTPFISLLSHPDTLSPVTVLPAPLTIPTAPPSYEGPLEQLTSPSTQTSPKAELSAACSPRMRCLVERHRLARMALSHPKSEM